MSEKDKAFKDFWCVSPDKMHRLIQESVTEPLDELHISVSEKLDGVTKQAQEAREAIKTAAKPQKLKKDN